MVVMRTDGLLRYMSYSGFCVPWATFSWLLVGCLGKNRAFSFLGALLGAGGY